MAIANRTGGQLLLSMFGKNLTSQEVDVYQMLITTGDPITFSMDALSSGNYAYQGVRGRNGAIIGQVQLDEEDPSGEISFSVYEDFDYVGSDYVYGNSKNKMLNLFNGEAFKNGTDIIVPIGTNGTDKTLTARAKFNEMNKPYKYLLYNEGFFIKEVGTADPKTGAVSMKKNPYEASFNQSHKTFCLEVMTTTGDGQVNRMLPIIAKSSLEWAEGDINQLNLTAQRGCDVFERDNFWTEILAEEPSTDEKIKELYVKRIVKEGATETFDDAQSDDLILLVKNDGTFEVKKYDSSWQKDTTIQDKLQVGTRIKATILREETTTDQNVNTFAVIGIDGKHLVDFSTNNSKRHFCKVFDFDKTKGQFVEYQTVE